MMAIPLAQLPSDGGVSSDAARLLKVLQQRTLATFGKRPVTMEGAKALVAERAAAAAPVVDAEEDEEENEEEDEDKVVAEQVW
jgi:hypothetical protein